MTSYGAQSMTAPLERVLLIPPHPEAGPADAWERAGWLPHDHGALLRQFDAFHQMLREAGVTVELAPPAPAENPDAIYAFDTVLITNAGYLLAAPPKPNRRAEPQALAPVLEGLGIPQLGAIRAPGTLDGGDTLWLSPHELAVGLSYRTNLSGVEQLRAMLQPLGVTVTAYDLPHVTGPEFCLHLLSLISPVTDTLAVIVPELLPVRLTQRLAQLDIDTVALAREEFDSLGSNILALGHGRVLAVEPNPRIHQDLRERGVELLTLHAPDLCIAGTGGPTCLTRPLLRSTS